MKFVILLILGISPVWASTDANPTDLFDQVLSMVKQYHVNRNRLVDIPPDVDTVDELFEFLGDKYATVYTKEQSSVVDEMLEDANVTTTGIGFRPIPTIDNNVLISLVYDQSPAFTAGLQRGDLITKIYGYDLATIDDPLERFDIVLGYGQFGSDDTDRNSDMVDITIYRPSIDKTMSMTIKKGTMYIPAAEVNILPSNLINNSVALYVRIPRFNNGIAIAMIDQLAEAIDTIRSAKVMITGLVLDLRGNGGGLLNTAVNIVDVFTNPDTTVVNVEDANSVDIEHLSSYRKKIFSFSTTPIVLVDGRSASASEIVTGFLQQQGWTVVGTTTYGKGTVQTSFGRIPPVVKFTTAVYTIGADHQPVDGIGITPDVVVPFIHTTELVPMLEIPSVPHDDDSEYGKTHEAMTLSQHEMMIIAVNDARYDNQLSKALDLLDEDFIKTFKLVVE